MTGPDTGAPSGQQFEIASGDQQVVVVEVGGGLRSYTIDGRDRLDGYGADAMCPSGRGQVLAPWPNRLEDGAYEFDGRHHQVPINEVEAHNAIHGLVRWEAWSVRERDPHRIVMEHVLRAEPGYPFPLALSIEYELSDTGLTVRTTAENVGRAPCPYGCGNHPYLTLGTPVDALTLHAPARTVLHADARGLPRSTVPVEGTEYDFRRARPIGTTVLDHCYTDLDRDDRGLARIDLGEPATGSGVNLWLDGSYPYVMLFTGDPLPDVARRALAVEPMSCPPNAFRSGDGVRRLEPGEAFTGSWGITPVGPVR